MIFLTPARPRKVSILKSSPLNNTAIEKNSMGIDRKFDSLAITVKFFDLRIFSSLSQMNFCRQTSIGTKFSSRGTRGSVQVLGNINRTGSGNPTIETVWLRSVPGVCS
jgi:hypothetical protein